MNVVFFTKGYPTENVWLYDGRSNVPGITKKDRPLTAAHFAEFERCFGADPNGRSPRAEADSPENRWRRFTVDEVKACGYKLDGLKWLKDEALDDPDDLAEPAELAAEAIAELEGALADLENFIELLEQGGDASKLLAFRAV